MKAQPYLELMERLVVERGIQKDKHFYATMTTKDICERSGEHPTEREYKYIMSLIKNAYPLTTFERANGDSGWILHFKIRVK